MKVKLLLISLLVFLLGIVGQQYYKAMYVSGISMSDSMDLFYISYEEENLTGYKKYMYGASGVGSMDVAGISQDLEELAMTSAQMQEITSLFAAYSYRRTWNTYIGSGTTHIDGHCTNLIFHVNASPGIRTSSTINICSDGYMVYGSKKYYMSDAALFIEELEGILDLSASLESEKQG